MKLKMKKKCKWGINYKAVDFNINQIVSVPEDVSQKVADEMVKHGYAVVKDGVEPVSTETVEVVKPESTEVPESPVETVEPVSTETVEDNQEKRKPGRPKKTDFSTHIPLKGQEKLRL